MALAFKCQKCGGPISVRRLFIGDSVECHSCGTGNKVPHQAKVVDLKENQPADDDASILETSSPAGLTAGGIRTSETAGEGLHTQSVVITDIHMSFSSMVAFMVKWAFASIPAVMIIGVFFVLFVTVLSGVTCGGIGLLGQN